MQVNSANLEDLKRAGHDYTNTIWDPCTNVMVGAFLLRQCYDRFGETWQTIDCYNKGSGNSRNNTKYTRRFDKTFIREIASREK